MQKGKLGKCICLLFQEKQVTDQRIPRCRRSLNEVRRLLNSWGGRRKKQN